MKNLITQLIAIFLFGVSFGQYNQRWLGIYPSNPLSKLHCFNDGLCTTHNLNSIDTSFYNAAVGSAIAPDSTTSSSDSAFSEFRFGLSNHANSVVLVNKGYAFKDATDTQNKWFNSFGKSLCEISSSTNNGGYMAVGYVTSNSRTGATTSGNSDGLIIKLSNTGTITTRIRVDFNNGSEILNHVIASKFSNDTYYACGASYSSTGSTLVVIKFRSSGNIIWAYNYNLNLTGSTTNNSNTIGYALCEDNNGNLLVVGSFSDADNYSSHGNDALIAKIRSNGNVLFTHVEDLFGSDDQYRMIKQSSDGQYLICGSTNSSSVYGIIFKKMPITSSVGVVVFSNKINVSGYDYCRSFDLIERPSASQYYIIGSGTLPGTEKKTVVIRTDPAGTLTLANEYANLKYAESVALDFSELSSSPGISIFANHIDSPSTTNTNAYLARTYFNGAVCNDECPVVIATQVHSDGSTVSVTNSKSKKATKKNLTSMPVNYFTGFICNDATVSCGSSTRMPGKVTSEEIIPPAEAVTISLFPNPVSEYINLKCNSDLSNATLRVLSISGFEITRYNINEIIANTPIEIRVSDLPPGTYIFQLISTEKLISKILIKE